jgi:hypothetical protein
VLMPIVTNIPSGTNTGQAFPMVLRASGPHFTHSGIDYGRGGTAEVQAVLGMCRQVTIGTIAPVQCRYDAP